MTFKDLKKRISSSNQQQQQQTQSFDKLQNKPFWIWNIEEHKQEDIRTKGECCFNRIVTGPNIDIAIKLIKRMKSLFERKMGLIFANKETVLATRLIESAVLIA
jgi:hypothetical protein